MVHMEHMSNKSLIVIVKEYWFLFLFTFTLIGGWFQIKNSVDTQELRLRETEIKLNNQATVIQAVAIDIASIKTSIDYIKDKIR